jgi:predicted transcriptional regulator
MTQINIKLSENLKKQAQKYAKENDYSLSRLIRESLRIYLKSQDVKLK